MNAMVQSLKGMTQIKLAAMIGTAVIMIAFFAYISLRVTAPTFAPLYDSVPVEDGGKIVSELELQNIPYELRRNGTQILVPADQVDKLRLTLAQQGLPSQGSMTGYEIFDKSDTLGTSNFVLSINQIRALEGELARTISSFETVDTARVHLVMPKRELFSRDAVEPTASVAVKLRGTMDLEKNEIAAIRNLVASAVPGLKPQRVTIVDSRGVLLAKGVDEKNDPNAVSEDAENFRSEYERNMVSRLERLLEQSVGPGKVKAEVNADIDFNRTVKNLEKYDPEGQVARSIQTIKEDENANESSASDNVSVANNLPAAQATGGAGASNASNRKRVEETTNFEISKEVTNSIKEAGVVRKLSVAILVDGIYTPAEAEGGAETYAPRSDEELKKLEQLVQSAIGFDANRGDTVRVVNMQFAPTPADLFETSPLDFLKQDLNSIIQTLVLGGIAILAILLVIRPLVARAIESAEAAAKEDEMEQAALAAPSIAARLSDQSRKANEEDDAPEEEGEDMINIDRIQGKLRSATYTKINNLVDKHPEETVQILRQWLAVS
jgi:flagellar M-ring protein FliF